MSNGFLPVDVFLHDSVLVDTDGGQYIQGVFVARVDTVKDHADDNLLPCRTAFVPELRFLQVDDITDVLHGTVKGSRRKRLILVVIRNRNEKFGVPVVHGRAQVITIVESELIGIASSRSVCNGKFLAFLHRGPLR